MPLTPDLPFPKSAGDAIRSKDWNDLVTETQRLDNAKVNRAGDAISGPLTIAGALGVGTTTPSAKLDVAGDLRINNSRLYLRAAGDNNHGLGWYGPGSPFAGANVDGPVLFGFSGGALGSTDGGQKLALSWNSNGDLRWGNNSSLKTDQGGSIELGGSSSAAGTGRPYIDFHFLGKTEDFNARIINDADGRLSISAGTLYLQGNVGIGDASPGERLDVDGRIKSGGLTIGPWQANANYVYFGTNTLDPANPGNYALLQDKRDGTTFLNSPENILFRIGNTDRMMLTKDGHLQILAGGNPVRFSSGWSGFNDSSVERAEISNDTGTYKTLMIVGNKSAGLGRRVSVWDRLEVNGDLLVTGRIGSMNKGPAALKAGWGGGLRTWDIEAEGTVWSRQAVQTGPRDVAEIYFSDLELDPGDLVSLDPDADRIIRSSGPADPTVIGILSTEPGFLLNSQLNREAPAGDLRPYPVALCGCVPCKVSDENGPIRRGDLLTTSSTPGHAMRAEPILLDGKSLYPSGTIIGKALAAHADGEGVIEVFVVLR